MNPVKLLIIIFLYTFSTLVLAEEIKYDFENNRVEIYWDAFSRISEIDGYNLYRISDNKKKPVNEKLITPGKSLEKVISFKDAKTFDDIILGKNVELPASYYKIFLKSYVARNEEMARFVINGKTEALYAGLAYWDYDVNINQQYEYELYEVVNGKESPKAAYNFKIDTSTKLLPVKVKVTSAKRNLWGFSVLSWEVSTKELKDKSVIDFNVLLGNPDGGMKKTKIKVFREDNKEAVTFSFMDNNAPEGKTAYFLEPVLSSHHRGVLTRVIIPPKKPRLPSVTKLQANRLPARIRGSHLSWEFDISEMNFGGFKIERFKDGEKKALKTIIIKDNLIREYADLFEAEPGATYNYKVHTVSSDERYDAESSCAFTMPKYFDLIEGPGDFAYKLIEKDGKPYASFSWKKSPSKLVKGYLLEQLEGNSWRDIKSIKSTEKLEFELDLSSFGHEVIKFGLSAFGDHKRSNMLVLSLESFNLDEKKALIKDNVSEGGFLKVKWWHKAQIGYTIGYRIYDQNDKMLLDEKSLPAGLYEAYIPGLVPNETRNFTIGVVYGDGKELKRSIGISTSLDLPKPCVFEGDKKFEVNTAKKKSFQEYKDPANKKDIIFYVEYLEDEKGIKKLDGKKYKYNSSGLKAYDLNYKLGNLDGVQKFISPVKTDEWMIYLYIEGKNVSLKDYEKNRGKLSLSENERKMIVNPGKI